MTLTLTERINRLTMQINHLRRQGRHAEANLIEAQKDRLLESTVRDKPANVQQPARDGDEHDELD